MYSNGQFLGPGGSSSQMNQFQQSQPLQQQSYQPATSWGTNHHSFDSSNQQIPPTLFSSTHPPSMDMSRVGAPVSTFSNPPPPPSFGCPYYQQSYPSYNGITPTIATTTTQVPSSLPFTNPAAPITTAHTPSHPRVKRPRDFSEPLEESMIEPEEGKVPEDELPPPNKRPHIASDEVASISSSSSTSSLSSHPSISTTSQTDSLFTRKSDIDPGMQTPPEDELMHSPTSPLIQLSTPTESDTLIDDVSLTDSAPSSPVDGEIDTDQWNLSALKLNVSESFQPLLASLSSDQAKRAAGLDPSILRSIQRDLEHQQRCGHIVRRAVWDKNSSLNFFDQHHRNQHDSPPSSPDSPYRCHSPPNVQQSLVLYQKPSMKNAAAAAAAIHASQQRRSSDACHVELADDSDDDDDLYPPITRSVSHHTGPIVTEVDDDEELSMASAAPSISTPVSPNSPAAAAGGSFHVSPPAASTIQNTSNNTNSTTTSTAEPLRREKRRRVSESDLIPPTNRVHIEEISDEDHEAKKQKLRVNEPSPSEITTQCLNQDEDETMTSSSPILGPTTSTSLSSLPTASPLPASSTTTHSTNQSSAHLPFRCPYSNPHQPMKHVGAHFHSTTNGHMPVRTWQHPHQMMQYDEQKQPTVSSPSNTSTQTPADPPPQSLMNGTAANGLAWNGFRPMMNTTPYQQQQQLPPQQQPVTWQTTPPSNQPQMMW